MSDEEHEEELNEEMRAGVTAAQQFVEHMLRMGASAAKVIVEFTSGPEDGSKFEVSVRKLSETEVTLQ